MFSLVSLDVNVLSAVDCLTCHHYECVMKISYYSSTEAVDDDADIARYAIPF